MINTTIINSGIEVLLSAFTSALIAQCLKMLFYYMRHKGLNFRILVETGGMPSSHSAFVLGLSAAVGIINGFASVEFAIAVGFAMIVMYDAAGLRRSAGKMARVLNNLVDELNTKKESHTSERLMELLGHTPMEVFMGAMLGFVVAFAVHSLLL